MDTKKSLDFQKFFIQLMEDLFLFHIRYTKKEIEREIKIIFLQLKKYLTECKTKSEFKEKSNTLSKKLKSLKEKLNQLNIEEKNMLTELKHRINKTFNCLNQKDSSNSNSTFLKLKEYNEYQNNILLGQYFLDKGLIETFFSFEKENNLKIYEYNYYAEKNLLINYINEEKTKKILEWVKFYKKKIIQNNPRIILDLLTNLFYIYKNEHINEIDCNINCITFIRKYFNDFTNENREDITKLIMSLIVPPTKGSKESDNKKLISNIKETISTNYKELFGLGKFSLFELLMTLGFTTLRTNICDKSTYNMIFIHKNNDCPICGKNGYNMCKMKNKIFNYVHNRSYLFCSITGKVTTASNPPMVNKDGRIICKNCLNKYKISEEKYIDPKTKEESKISDWKLLYLS
jgi:hypothetical protein